MKVVAWLADSMSARIGFAVVEVEAQETADIEAMLTLIDGDSVGHFGVDAQLVATEGFNIDDLVRDLKAKKTWTGQFGFPNASAMRTRKRYYKVMVSRD